MTQMLLTTLCGENEGVQISCAVTRAADQGLCFHICKKHVFVIKRLVLGLSFLTQTVKTKISLVWNFIICHILLETLTIW